MTEERFETETILRETTVDIERPVELGTDGTPAETETLGLPATERVEVVTCERYPSYCPRRDGYVPVGEAVVVGVDTVDRATGTESAVALAYCPECAASEFDYVRERDDPSPDGRTLHERYGYVFGTRGRSGVGRILSEDAKSEAVKASVALAALALLGALLTTVGAPGLVVWGILATATAAGAIRIASA
ncbi:hypothetical protein NGM10_13885 [Halorussus salilacus]|uniref:hypothetical protein n=1 Tax=Halorussus salilacus TaxID=2953750 RepID=UPI00209F1500|nr:hypothetical protein [Halorussus salilacus]USZ67812.1 hypothetical protein NGM10_13885 [Halorussus salilacus]